MRARGSSITSAIRFSRAQLKVGEPHLFNYPFVASPVFLLAMEQRGRRALR